MYQKININFNLKFSHNITLLYYISKLFQLLIFLKIQLSTIIENIKLIALSFHLLPYDFLIIYNYLTINLSWKQCRPYYNFQLRWVNHNLLYFKSFSLLQTFWDTFQIKYSSHDYSCRQGGSSLFCGSAPQLLLNERKTYWSFTYNTITVPRFISYIFYGQQRFCKFLSRKRNHFSSHYLWNRSTSLVE